MLFSKGKKYNFKHLERGNMGYDIQLFRSETKEKEQSVNDPNFFENESNFEPFTNQQYNELKDRLIQYDFELNNESDNGIEFTHEEFSIHVLLTKRCLYFSSGFDEDSIFETGMTASEFTDSGYYAKYDPQNGGWESF